MESHASVIDQKWSNRGLEHISQEIIPGYQTKVKNFKSFFGKFYQPISRTYPNISLVIFTYIVYKITGLRIIYGNKINGVPVQYSF
jgi:hypothetical protein